MVTSLGAAPNVERHARIERLRSHVAALCMVLAACGNGARLAGGAGLEVDADGAADVAAESDDDSEVDAAAWKRPYVDNREALSDPWGRQYLLQVPGKKNVDFDIVSYGADGQPGGQGDNADIIAP